MASLCLQFTNVQRFRNHLLAHNIYKDFNHIGSSVKSINWCVPWISEVQINITAKLTLPLQRPFLSYELVCPCKFSVSKFVFGDINLTALGTFCSTALYALWLNPFRGISVLFCSWLTFSDFIFCILHLECITMSLSSWRHFPVYSLNSHGPQLIIIHKVCLKRCPLFTEMWLWPESNIILCLQSLCNISCCFQIYIYSYKTVTLNNFVFKCFVIVIRIV